MLVRICVWLVLACLVPAAFAADAWSPERRTIEYPWMSVARWNQMHEGFLKRAKEGPVDVLFLGDSITEGWGGAGREVWTERFQKKNAANFGIGGDKTQQVLWRITEGAELEGISPKVCVLMIGTNNFGLGGEEPENVVKGIRAIIDALRAKHPKLKILLLAIFPRDEKPETNFRKKISAVNAELAKLADGKSLVYLDLAPRFLAQDGTLSKEIMPDFLHLSPKGYQIWGEAISGDLEKLLKE
jgi:lysophospholipase L1-like esterase